MKLNAVQQLAIVKAIGTNDAKACRSNVNPGTHIVDLTVRISGRMTVGEDYTVAPTVSIPLKETMAFLIRRMGVTRTAAVALLRDSMADAIAANEGKGQGALESTIVEEAMQIVENDIIAHLPRQPRSGVVKPYLAIETIAATSAVA